MLESEDRWQRLIQGLRTGDRLIVQEFCEQYGALLERLAERHLSEGLRRRVGAEDVVQSAYRTFLRRAQAGEFQLSDSEGLWRLLCAITLAKVRELARYHGRQKRGFEQEVPLGKSDEPFGLVAPGPSPAEAAEFADQFQQLMASLDEEERRFVDLKLQQCTNLEVAARLGCSERTVRRILKRVQSRLESAFQVSSP
ncbi:MAG TPA: sigma-70 family RNA polymerase sigma factor [Gemmataceae bacterium]|nr:sigma-70 family RNA polymerase sigma factor [Gemmataceae bacterium]